MYSSVCGPKTTVISLFSGNQWHDSAEQKNYLRPLEKKKLKDLTISTFMVLVWRPHTGTNMHAAVTSWYATETVKTAHIKAKKHTHSHPHIYTVLCRHAHKLTQRDRFTLSAHFFLGLSIRLKPVQITVNTNKNSKLFFLWKPFSLTATKWFQMDQNTTIKTNIFNDSNKP